MKLREREDYGSFDYDRLFNILYVRKIRQRAFAAGIESSTTVLNKLRNGLAVSSDVICRICEYLKVQPGDIMEYIPPEGYEDTRESKKIDPNVVLSEIVDDFIHLDLILTLDKTEDLQVQIIRAEGAEITSSIIKDALEAHIGSFSLHLPDYCSDNAGFLIIQVALPIVVKIFLEKLLPLVKLTKEDLEAFNYAKGDLSNANFISKFVFNKIVFNM